MNKKINLIFSSVAATVLLTGCSFKDINPSPDVVVPEKYMPKQISKKYSIKEGETLAGLVKKIETESNVNVIDKTRGNLIFDRSFDAISMDEVQSYIKLQFNRDIVLRKYSDTMFAMEEHTPELKKDYDKEGSFKLPDISFKVHGDFTYEQLFNILREKNINIDVDIQNRTSEQAFKLSKIVPEFAGNLESFLSFVGAHENLFVKKTDKGVLLKDVDTVTYNLKLPQVKMDPALSPDGGRTAVTGVEQSTSYSQSTSTTSSGINSTTSATTNPTTSNSTQSLSTSNGGARGTMAPIDELDAQFKALLEKKALYAINKTSSTLAITGDYESIKTADKLVQDFHDIYGKSVQLELNIYQVVINDDKAFGIDYTMLEQELIGSTVLGVKKAIDTSLTNILPTVTGGISITNNSGVIKVEDTSGELVKETYQKTNGVVFKYLNKFGRASVMTKPMLGTINNLPVKLDIVDSKDYVYKLSSTNNVSTGANVSTGTSTIEPEIRTLTTGFSLILHPKVENDYIKIALKSVVSDDNGFKDYSYSSGTDGGEVKIKLKDVSSRQFEEMVKLKNNEIAIIGGYMYERRASDKNGLPLTGPEDSAFDALTSAKNSSTEKVEIVMTIRARAM